MSVYAPQCGLRDAVIDLCYNQLCAMTTKILGSVFLVPCGDCNEHGGSTDLIYNEVHCGYKYPEIRS